LLHANDVEREIIGSSGRSELKHLLNCGYKQ